jgi:hypothetical protein
MNFLRRSNYERSDHKGHLVPPNQQLASKPPPSIPVQIVARHVKRKGRGQLFLLAA